MLSSPTHRRFPEMVKAIVGVVLMLSLAAAAFVAVDVVGPRVLAEDQAKSQSSRPDNTPPEGFTALFNGKDLTGWKGLPVKEKLDNPIKRAAASPDVLKQAQAAADERMREHWKVEDGALVFDGK